MARYTADMNRTGFFYESGTYATTTGTTLQWIGGVQNFDADDSTGVFRIRYQGTHTRNVDQFVDGPLDHTGTLSYYPQDWKMLVFALGSNADVSGTTSTHTISELSPGSSSPFISGTDNPFTSFAIEHSEKAVGTGQNFVRTYKGCVVDELSISMPQSEPVTVDVNWIAQNVTFSSGAPTSITEDTSRPFLWSDVKVHIPSGTVYDNITNARFTIRNNLEPKHFDNGSRVITVPVPGYREYMLELTLDGTSERTKTLYDQYFLGGSTFNAILDLTVASNRNIAITLSGCKLVDMAAPGGLTGVNQQTVTIEPKNCVALVSDTTPKYNPW